MNLKTKGNDEDDEIKTYNCTFNKLSNNNAELECDTSKCPINTNVENLHLSNGISDDGTFLTIEMDNWQTNGSQIVTGNNRIFYSKSSSGLSGGSMLVLLLLVLLFS